MPDVALLDIQGARPPKPNKYTPIATLKWIGGLQTQRSPFMPIDTRYNTRVLGGKPDALISGSNCEISNKLTLQRRPGLDAYGVSNIPAPDFFFSWQQATLSNFIAAVDPTGVIYPSGNLQLIVDTATNGTSAPGNIYNYSPTNSGIILNKSPLSGQTSFYTVVNTMYMGDGVDLYKMVGANLLKQSNTFGNAPWVNSSTTLTTGDIDPTGGTAATQFAFVGTASGMLQAVTPNYTPVASNTFTFSIWLKALTGNNSVQLVLEDQANNIIANQSFTITNSWTLYQITGTALNTATSLKVNISTTVNTAETFDVYGTQLEVGGPATPTTITTGAPLGVYLWGIQAPTIAPTFTITQQTGSTGLPWQPNHNYSTVTASVGQIFATGATVAGAAVYTATFSGGAANGLVGRYFSIAGDLVNPSNNSVAPGFICVASSATTITLNNLSAIAEASPSGVTATLLDTIVDSNGNLEVAYVPGKSGGSQPMWNPVVGNATPDGLQNLVVQNASAISTGATVSSAYPSNVTATNTKLIFITVRAPGSLVVTDSSGDTPVLFTSKTERDFKIYLYYVLSATSGASTISVTGGGNSGTWLGIAELAMQTATDGSNTNGAFNTLSGLFLSGAVTNTNTPDVLVSFALFSNSGVSGFEIGNLPLNFQGIVSQTQTTVGANGGSGPANWNMAAGFEVLSNIASVNPQWTITNPSNGSTILAGITGAFKSSVGSLIWYNVGQNATTGLTPKTGYTYYYSFVNPYTGHRSNVSPLSASTGPQTGVAINVSGVGMQTVTSGKANQDPQVQAIEVYRNVDGGGFWYQIPPALMTNTSGLVTINGVQYLANPGTASSPGTWSFTDVVLDSQLNTQIFAPVAFLNSPPPAGLINLEFANGRLFGSVGGTQYFATGADDATLINVVQNGVSAESWEPTNTIPYNSPIVRQVATGSGLVIFTTTDVWGLGGTNLATFNPIKILTGIGLGTYNGLCIDGSTIFLYTRDRQNLIFNVNMGCSEIGFLIGDLIETNINPITCYLARHVKGSQDNAFYLGDGVTGWFRMNPNNYGASMQGEQTPIWSPFATINGGAAALASIETSPGIKNLLVGQIGSQTILVPPPPIKVANTVTQHNTSTATMVVNIGNVNIGDFVCVHATGIKSGSATLAQVQFSYNLSVTEQSESGSGAGGGGFTYYGDCVKVNQNGALQSTITFTDVSMNPVSVDDGWVAAFIARNAASVGFAASGLPTTGTTPAPSTITATVTATTGNLLVSAAFGNTGTSLSTTDSFIEITTSGIVGGGEVAIANLIATTTGSTTSTWSKATFTVASESGFYFSHEVLWNFTPLAGTTGVGGPILNRDINTFTDNGTTYTWNAVMGSLVLALPGKLSEIESITTEMNATDSVNQCNVAVLIDEIAESANLKFEDITNIGTNPVNDPPQLDDSESVLSNRFYLAAGEVPPLGRHLQVKLSGAATATKDEILAATIRGASIEEQS